MNLVIEWTSKIISEAFEGKYLSSITLVLSSKTQSDNKLQIIIPKLPPSKLWWACFDRLYDSDLNTYFH
jgi:hypothetical protein